MKLVELAGRGRLRMTISLEPAPDWQRRAACRGTDLNLFFSDHGNRALNAKAKSICAGCPVRLPCLEMALSAPVDEYGVFGGCTVAERRVLRRQRRQSA